MLPETLLLHRRDGGAVLPRFLEPADLEWLQEMLVRREQAIGRPQIELEKFLLGAHPFAKRRLVAKVLAGITRPLRESAIEPVRTRAAVFAAATEARIATGGDRARAIAIAAERLGAKPADVEASLFADLPGEKKVAPLAATLSPEELRRRVNAALIAGFLLRAVQVTVKTERDPLPLVRHARWNGLIAERRDGGVALSGPFALFQHTGIYGRALAGILPGLAALGQFTAEVALLLRTGGAGRMVFDETAPVFAGDARTSTASPAGRLIRDIHKTAPGWAAVADPEPLAGANGELLDADVLVVPPEGGPPFRVELLRFWTAAQVRQRIERWSAAGVEAFLLLDGSRNTAEEPAPEHPSVIVFKRGKPDAAPLLARIRTLRSDHGVARREVP